MNFSFSSFLRGKFSDRSSPSKFRFILGSSSPRISNKASQDLWWAPSRLLIRCLSSPSRILRQLDTSFIFREEPYIIILQFSKIYLTYIYNKRAFLSLFGNKSMPGYAHAFVRVKLASGSKEALFIETKGCIDRVGSTLLTIWLIYDI